MVEITLNVALRDERHLETMLIDLMHISYQAVVFLEKKSTSPKMTWRVQEVAEMFHKFISHARCIGPQLPHLPQKFPGKTSTGAEDYVAKEVFRLWGWMFYLSTIKGIDSFWSPGPWDPHFLGLVGTGFPSGDLHAIKMGRESSCVVRIWFTVVDDNCWCWMAMITGNEKVFQA